METQASSDCFHLTAELGQLIGGSVPAQPLEEETQPGFDLTAELANVLGTDRRQTPSDDSIADQDTQPAVDIPEEKNATAVWGDSSGNCDIPTYSNAASRPPQADDPIEEDSNDVTQPGVFGEETAPQLGAKQADMETLEETAPPSPGTLMAAVRFNEDGTLAPSLLQVFEEEDEREDSVEPEDSNQNKDPLATSSVDNGAATKRVHPPVSRAPGKISEISDGEGSGDDRAGEPGSMDLLDEPWMMLPDQERAMWERVRPRALRREAAQLRAMRLPVSSLRRLMALHPGLAMQGSSATEALNLATVLLVQALVRAAIKEKGQARGTIQLSDVRQACVGTQELQFLYPFEGTFDPSASSIRVNPNMDLNADADADGHTRVGKNNPVPPTLAPGQKTLNSGLFAAQAIPFEVEVEADENAPGNLPEIVPAPEPKKDPKKPTGLRVLFGDHWGPVPVVPPKSGAKRKVQGSKDSKGGKVAKIAKPSLPANVNNLANLFRRAGNAGS